MVLQNFVQTHVICLWIWSGLCTNVLVRYAFFFRFTVLKEQSHFFLIYNQTNNIDKVTSNNPKQPKKQSGESESKHKYIQATRT